MKVAGFTFIRNAVRFDFPVVEAITSVLPLCDDFFVAVGCSSDGTLDLIRNIDPVKVRILETDWDETPGRGGAVYAEETNKAFDAIPEGYDWCFYIQGDEVLHEKFLETVHSAMWRWKDDIRLDGLLFDYRHFYGSFDYTGDSRHWYRREVRIIRNDKTIRSYRDAQGFRKNGKKLIVRLAEAEIYHYGWVRHPRYMQEKIDAVRQYYDGIKNGEQPRPSENSRFDYDGNYDALALFTGTHPRVMMPRIERLSWKVNIDVNKKNMSLRYRVLYFFEKMTGIRPFEFRNYRIIPSR